MRRHDRLLRKMLRKRYLVTTKDGEAFDGVLYDVDDQHIVLVDADHVDTKGERVRVDGQLWIPRTTIAYLQHVNP